MTQAFSELAATVHTTTTVRALPERDELRRLRQIRALRALLRRAAELAGEAA